MKLNALYVSNGHFRTLVALFTPDKLELSNAIAAEINLLLTKSSNHRYAYIMLYEEEKVGINMSLMEILNKNKWIE